MVDLADRTEVRVGVEISKSGFTAVSVDPNDLVTTIRSGSANMGESMVAQLADFINALKADLDSIKDLGLAIPGLVDRKAKRVTFSTHVPEFSSVDLVAEISSSTGLDVIIDNDANAAAYGEFRLGAGRGARNMFYVTLGEGIGGAFIVQGEIWHGAAGYAGEFGYVPINSEGMRLEEVASAGNIIRRTRNRFHQDSTSSLNKLSEEQITLASIISAADKDDDFAAMMLERTGIYVGTAVATVINLLNVEKIVIGGEIMGAKHLVLGAIVHRARELSFSPSFDSTEILEGELGAAAAAAGAALLAGEA